jgi:hypothetical protein
LALHTDAATFAAGRFQGSALQKVLGIVSAAHIDQILCSQTTAALLASRLPPDTTLTYTLTYLGVFDLQSYTLSEPLYQANCVDLPNTFPPLHVPRASRILASPNVVKTFRSELPIPLDAFVGRDKEITDLQRLITVDRRRLITLNGLAGMGKTRLSLELGKRLCPTYSSAVWFVPLTHESSADQIAVGILNAMRLPISTDLNPFCSLAILP